MSRYELGQLKGEVYYENARLYHRGVALRDEQGVPDGGSLAPLAKSGEVLPHAVINNHCIWLNGYGYYLCCFCGDQGTIASRSLETINEWCVMAYNGKAYAPPI